MYERATIEKPYMDRQWLFNEYVTKDRSSQEIADDFGCARNTIQQYLAKYKISKPVVRRVYKKKRYNERDYLYEQHIVLGKSIREIAEENSVSYDTIRTNLVSNGIDIIKRNSHKKYSEEEIDEMVRLYCECGLSTNRIAKMYNTDHGLVKRYMRMRGVKTRDMSEAQFMANGKELHPDLNDAELMRKMHWEDGFSCVDIGRLYDIDPGAVRRQLHRIGVQTKNNAESKVGLMVGESHPNWQGGKSSLKALLREYFDVNQAPMAAKRDNYTCQICGATHTKLHVHHIIHFADIVDTICNENPNLNPDNENDRQVLYDIITHDSRFLDLDNLITYCSECHLFKVHGLKKRKTISSQAS